MTTDTTKTEHEGPIEFDGNGVTWRLLTGPTLGREFTDARPGDVIAALSANPQLRAAVLVPVLRGMCDSGFDEYLRALPTPTPDAQERALAAAHARLRAAESALATARLENSDLSYQLGKAQGEAEGHALVRKGLESELAAERARVAAAEAMVEDATELALWLKSLDWYQPHSVVARRDRIIAASSGDEETVAPRPVVRWFAEQMELALRRNDHKGGWHSDAPSGLLSRIDDESHELLEAIDNDDAPAVLRESADVANMAMMVADHYREDGPSRDQGHSLASRPAEQAKQAVAEFVTEREEQLSRAYDSPLTQAARGYGPAEQAKGWHCPKCGASDLDEFFSPTTREAGEAERDDLKRQLEEAKVRRDDDLAIMGQKLIDAQESHSKLFAQLEAARASAADPGELEHLRESCAALSAQVDALENLVGEATKHVESDTRAEWLSEQVLALRSISARDQKRAAPVAEEPRRPNYCPSCDTVAVTGTVRCPACSRVLIAQPDVDSLCACGHRYGAHERGTNGPCKDCDCAHWREPAAAQPSPAQEPKPPAGHWSDCAECVRDGGYCLKHPAQPEPAIDTALFDGLPNWLDDMRDALGDFHPDSPLHVSAAKLGEFAGATLAFLNGLHEHLKEQKPLTRANVTAIVDARVAELAKAAAELKRGSNAAWPMLALAEAAEGKGS